MKPTPQKVQNIYLSLLLFNTLASSLIWGINTIFLLDAGLSNTQAFLANSFFTIGQVLFEVPTGMVADLRGRRTSYLLGALTLSLSTLLYLGAWMTHAPFIAWAISSVLLGLGFTFFSGATEAWLVDSLKFSGFKGSLESVFAKGQVVGGVAMLLGSVSGGFIAQIMGLSAPYILRALLLGLTFVIAFVFMKDWGYTPKKSVHLAKDIKNLFKTSFKLGVGNPAVRWIMLAAPFSTGVGFYAFYAMQPYLLEVYKDEKAYGIAGLAAAIVAGAQIVGSFMVPHLKGVFKKRTSILLFSVVSSAMLLGLIGISTNFWVIIGLLCLWGLISSASMPVRQTYLNSLIPSEERATVLSFDSMIGSAGGVVIQPALGKVADVQSYGSSFVVSGVIQVLAMPFVILAKKENTKSDEM